MRGGNDEHGPHHHPTHARGRCACLREAGIRTLTVAAQRWNFTSFPRFFRFTEVVNPSHDGNYAPWFVRGDGMGIHSEDS